PWPYPSRKRPDRLGEGHGGRIEEAITGPKICLTERHYAAASVFNSRGTGGAIHII
ncbi:MAG: hypothetical protein JWQ10_1680, partial [Herbaspirillum sp.]|nr:hypothetical protein [Herbaspirillum sp.]